MTLWVIGWEPLVKQLHFTLNWNDGGGEGAAALHLYGGSKQKNEKNRTCRKMKGGSPTFVGAANKQRKKRTRQKMKGGSPTFFFFVGGAANKKTKNYSQVEKIR